ncbi:MAG: anthranilate synthase component I [Pseudomonadota bacterium]
MFEPSFDTFQSAYNSNTPQVVFTKLVADLETPVSAFLKLTQDEDYSFLFESVEGGSVRGRYSIIGCQPDIIWRSNDQRVEINTTPQKDLNAFKPVKGNTLEALRDLLKDSKIDLPKHLPPMAAGVFGFMGYDTVRLIEHLPDESPDPVGLPDSLMLRPTLIIVFDAVKNELIAVTPVRPEKRLSAKTAYLRAKDRLTTVIDRLDELLPHTMSIDVDQLVLPEVTSNTSPQEYMKIVRAAKKYIAAGDIFQVVLSQRFSTQFPLEPFALYRALRRTNPSPFLFYLNMSSFSVIGSSPEILVRSRDGEVTMRPIAGTRARGETEEQDIALEKELLADKKERAEHLMLLDLGRNDVGRVATVGSVNVTDSFFIERYSQVMHIVSNVIGKLDAKKYDTIDALMAGFPAGTVSGAPKVRAMEIIDELEKDKRGIYAGCVGYFSANGDMDSCIVLRTAILKDGVMHVQSGAGIVADSVPKKEQAECLNKAKALFRAAEEAVHFALNGRRGQ